MAVSAVSGSVPAGEPVDDVSTCGYSISMVRTGRTRNRQLAVREAKNRFSELLGRAAQGEQIVITRHGKPFARLSRVADGPGRFEVDWEWLREMKVAVSQTPTENLVRAERDGRS